MEIKIIYCLISILFLSCNTDKFMNYQYSDGNNNTYTITYEMINYYPLGSELSSSGNYNGGCRFSKPLSKTDYQQIQKLFQKAISNKSIHLKSRVMMSGLVKIEKDGQIYVYILQPGSQEKIAIEEYLALLH